MKVLCVIAVVVMLAVLALAPVALAADVSKDGVITIAKKALTDKSIDLADCNVLYDEGNDSWEDWGEYVERTPNDNNHGILPHGVLETYKYQAVYFDFYDDAKKDVWVFVDPATENVLAIYEKK